MRNVRTERLLTDKLAAAEDDEGTNPDGPSEVNKTPEELNKVVSTAATALYPL